MELKAQLQKPYTEKEKFNFLIENNYKKNYKITETEVALEAWGLTEEELLISLKEQKYLENDEKSDFARYNKSFTIAVQNKICMFDTSAKTQTDLLTAFAVCSTGLTYDGWITNNGIELDLTLNDVALISAKFKELSNVYPKWNYFKTLIDEAQTIAEVKEIIINYEV